MKYVFGNLDSDDVYLYYWKPISDTYAPYGWIRYNFDKDLYEIQVSNSGWSNVTSENLWHMSRGSEE